MVRSTGSGKRKDPVMVVSLAPLQTGKSFNILSLILLVP